MRKRFLFYATFALFFSCTDDFDLTVEDGNIGIQLAE